MNINESEELFLRSLDTVISEAERIQLAALEQNLEFKNKSQQLVHVRALLARNEANSFGPFFAERIAYRISQLKQEIDYQIFFFFKRYQLLAAGIVIALLALNILLSDQLSIKSILGFEDQAIDDVISIDLYSNLTK
jgi:hypothetical protein